MTGFVLVSLAIYFISTHTPVRVWRISYHSFYGAPRFQLTHPWGCDFFQRAEKFSTVSFQLTHPWGCDLQSRTIQCSITLFQLTHPWGCDILDRLFWKSGWFQLTHPWGCDLVHNDIYDNIFRISTHTPVRVWRKPSRVIKYPKYISTHTPVRVWLRLSQ